ncbi:YihY family inner membrane protein [Rhodobacterales bacterium HKCCE4037]|nr:YihY family inner membrane protein [Rhodobacterales bacterium HKCCE4037]
MSEATASEGNRRGRDATTPAQMTLKGWRDVLFRVKDKFIADHVSVVAAGVAFFGLLAIFPAIVASISTAALVLDPSQISTQLDAMLGALPGGAAEIISGQVEDVLSDEERAGWTFALGLFLAIFAAARGMSSLIEGMNIAYDEVETRGFIQLTLLAIGLTLLATVTLVLAMSVTVVIPTIFSAVGYGDTAEAVLGIVRWPFLALLMLVGLAVLYRFGPDRSDAKWVWLTPGSVLAVALWLIGTAAFTVYVENFGSYNETYGSIGAVIVLLTWFWMSALIVMLGAEVNAELEHQTKRDSTTGEPRPIGERGAVKADHVGPVP